MDKLLNLLCSGTPQAGSDIGSEADGLPSEISDSTGNVEDATPDMKVIESPG